MQLDESPVALGRGGGDRLARIGVLAAADQEATVAERARAIDAFDAGQLDRFRRAPEATGDRRLVVGVRQRFVVDDHTARDDHHALTDRLDLRPAVARTNAGWRLAEVGDQRTDLADLNRIEADRKSTRLNSSH